MAASKKEFLKGATMAVIFFIVLAYMFSPSFGDGRNAFSASDDLFNSISKGSTYYIPSLREQVQPLGGKVFKATVELKSDKLAGNAEHIFATAGAEAKAAGQGCEVSGDLGAVLTRVLDDSDAMFHNKGDALSSAYGIEEREAMYTWWRALTSLETELKHQKEFKAAKVVSEVIKRGVEVGYNYYGIVPQSAAGDAGVLTFALIFYVVYTLWWGYSIFFMAEGMGLAMKGGHKKET
jgi:hypothetical protein